MSQAPALPDLPPHVFASLQVLERALVKTPMTRAEHIESEQALNGLAQYCVQANQASKAAPLPPSEVPDENGRGRPAMDLAERR